MMPSIGILKARTSSSYDCWHTFEKPLRIYGKRKVFGHTNPYEKICQAYLNGDARLRILV